MHKKEEISVKTDTSSLFYASNEPKSVPARDRKLLNNYAAVRKIATLCLSRIVYTIMPRIPQEITSPIPTVPIRNGIGSGT